MQFQIEKMTCGGCAKTVTKALLSVDPKAEVSADPTARLVSVNSSISRQEFEAVLQEAGYPAASEG